uniref:Uncharacterized protein n=1 Tax=Glossina palpalis gambiensis TaxID=67801 RepID=A0A1B0BZQ5_9MUSC
MSSEGILCLPPIEYIGDLRLMAIGTTFSLDLNSTIILVAVGCSLNRCRNYITGLTVYAINVLHLLGNLSIAASSANNLILNCICVYKIKNNDAFQWAKSGYEEITTCNVNKKSKEHYLPGLAKRFSRLCKMRSST